MTGRPSLSRSCAASVGRGAQGEARNGGPKILSAFAPQEVGAFHCPFKCFENTEAVVFVRASRENGRLLPHHPLAFHLLDPSARVVDEPVAAEGLDVLRPMVFNFHKECEHELMSKRDGLS